MSEEIILKKDYEKDPPLDNVHPLYLHTDPRNHIAHILHLLSKNLEIKDDQLTITLSSLNHLEELSAMVEVDLAKKNTHLSEQLLSLLGKQSALMKEMLEAKTIINELQTKQLETANQIDATMTELRVQLSDAMKIWSKIRDLGPLH